MLLLLVLQFHLILVNQRTKVASSSICTSVRFFFRSLNEGAHIARLTIHLQLLERIILVHHSLFLVTNQGDLMLISRQEEITAISSIVSSL